MFESYKFKMLTPEGAIESPEDFEEEFISFIERISEEPERKIGEGRTAEVFILDNPRLCVKVMRRKEAMGGAQMRPTTKIPFHRSAEEEGLYIEKARAIQKNVKVPRALFALKKEMFEKREVGAIKYTVEILAMTRVEGPSLKDVIEGKEKLPEDFDNEKFFGALKEFVLKMNQEGLYHRDIHPGNIMLEDQIPVVIDFGTAVVGTEESAYTEQISQGGNLKTLTFRRTDEESLEDTKVELEEFLTNL